MKKFKMIQLINKVETRIEETVLSKKIKTEIAQMLLDVKNEAINYTRCCEELPNVYEGSLNSERIKQVNNLKELYTINSTTISDIFCRGVNWYKQKLTK